MHKGVILLVKAQDKEEAKQEVSNFMEQYGDGDVWDWYDHPDALFDPDAFEAQAHIGLGDTALCSDASCCAAYF